MALAGAAAQNNALAEARKRRILSWIADAGAAGLDEHLLEGRAVWAFSVELRTVTRYLTDLRVAGYASANLGTWRIRLGGMVHLGRTSPEVDDPPVTLTARAPKTEISMHDATSTAGLDPSGSPSDAAPIDSPGTEETGPIGARPPQRYRTTAGSPSDDR